MAGKILTYIQAIGLTALTLCCCVSCSGNQAPKHNPNLPVPVKVGTVTQRDVPVQLRAIGNVDAYSTVSVKSQVSGELKQIYFKEGQLVRKGELLFTIDPQPYSTALNQAQATLQRDLAAVRQAKANLERDLAQVRQAKANLKRDMTLAHNADVEARRYEDLIAKGFTSQEEYDQYRTNANALKATVKASGAGVENAQAIVDSSQAALENAYAGVKVSEAEVANAQIQLGYCTICSPIDGRTGALILQEGNLIKANDSTPLVIIHQIHPIYVIFSVPEQNLPDIKKYMALGKLKVEASPASDNQPPESGYLTFVDNEVDVNTGTIKLKGTFANLNRRLWPGQFVNVVLTLTHRPNTLLVPSQAIQTGQKDQYVVVVKADKTAEFRSIIPGEALNGETIVLKGVQSGETVVTDGQLRLLPGSSLEIITPGNHTPPSENPQ